MLSYTVSPMCAYRAGFDETCGDDDSRSGYDRRGYASGRRFPGGAHPGEEDSDAVQPHDPTALEAGLIRCQS